MHCGLFGFNPKEYSLRKVLLENYYILVLGDSIEWGQGLREDEKYYSVVKRYIQERFRDREVHIVVLAHSGATIGIGDHTKMTSLFGEIPKSYPTILQQCVDFEGIANCIDLVLANGGLNDINARTILNPFESDPALLELVNNYFYRDMKLLLTKIVSKYYKARLVFSGYYPLVGEKSDLHNLGLLLVAIGVLVGGPVGGAGAILLDVLGKESMVRRSRIFATESTKKLNQSVKEVNASISPTMPTISLAIPNFGEENAVFASDPWVFGINPDLSSEDSIADSRSKECDRLGLTGVDAIVCKKASICHPNSKGAKEYARVIISLL